MHSRCVYQEGCIRVHHRIRAVCLADVCIRRDVSECITELVDVCIRRDVSECITESELCA